MMRISRCNIRTTMTVFFVFTLVTAVLGHPCFADRKMSTDSILRGIVHEVFGINGYWFTDSSAQAVLGTPKFASDTTLYVKPARWHDLLVTGGIELIGASDHWQPFSGGSQFSLNGASFRISAPPARDRLIPFISGGVFAGHIRSERTAFQGFKTTQVVPSLAAGAELKVFKYVTLTGRYRVTGHIRGVNTDGFFIGMKLF